MSKALDDVLSERKRQEEMWGEQNHDPFLYLTILTEEVGEFAHDALETRFGKKDGYRAAKRRDMRTEAVQVAAVALAIVECLDRGKWTWGHGG